MKMKNQINALSKAGLLCAGLLVVISSVDNQTLLAEAFAGPSNAPRNSGVSAKLSSNHHPRKLLFLQQANDKYANNNNYISHNQHGLEKFSHSNRRLSSLRLSAPEKEDDMFVGEEDQFFNGRTTVALVGGQSLLVGLGALVAWFIGTPNFGFGSGISWTLSALTLGTLFALPLGGLAAALDLVEERFPALQDVTKATQRSVLSLMGGTFKPVLALVTATALGLAAGFGEELLFRGVFQYEVANRFSPFLGITISSIVFGLLHAVTPLYAFLATVASFYFGALYLYTDNLAVPIACHAIYDVGALFYAHWTVCQLTFEEMQALLDWEGPTTQETTEK